MLPLISRLMCHLQSLGFISAKADGTPLYCKSVSGGYILPKVQGTKIGLRLSCVNLDRLDGLSFVKGKYYSICYSIMIYHVLSIIYDLSSTIMFIYQLLLDSI